MPKIIFWSIKNRPSFEMRGRQLVECLQKRGYQAEALNGPAFLALAKLRNSIIVCVKSIPMNTRSLKKRGNTLVYDAIDFQGWSFFLRGMDAVLTPNQNQQQKFGQSLDKRKTVLETVYHHADPFLKVHRAGDESLKLVYIGEPESSKFIDGEISELSRVSFKMNPDWRENLRDYNAHFSCRMDHSKSVVKLANASRMGAVYVCGREAGVVELLGDDYPFYLKDVDNIDQVKKDISRIASLVGKPDWSKAQARVASVKEQLSISGTCDAYLKLFTDLRSDFRALPE